LASIPFLVYLASSIRCSLLHVAGFSSVADFPIYSSGPAALDIAAAVIPYGNSVPAVMASMLLILLLLFAFLLLRAVMLSFLLLLDAGVAVVACTAVACVPVIAIIHAVAGEAPDVSLLLSPLILLASPVFSAFTLLLSSLLLLAFLLLVLLLFLAFLLLLASLLILASLLSLSIRLRFCCYRNLEI
jgi:hypothetical protein